MESGLATGRRRHQRAFRFSFKHKTQTTQVDEPCPKCAHPEMSFYTMQLRSADEGSTVFYECLNKACGHKFSVNN